jgi:Tfp pilus assembly protein PilX
MLPLPGVRNDRPLAQLDLEIELTMNENIRRLPTRLPTPRSQRGTMLIIALIVLVAMTLAGIATMRSVDTATLMAGNIAFRQSALNAVDQGLQAGYALIGTVNADLTKDSTQWTAPAIGFYSSAPTTEPNWSDPAVWNNADRPAVKLNGGAQDAAGNVVWFIAERLCLKPNCKALEKCDGVVNLCGSTPSAGTLSKEGEDNFRVTGKLNAIPQPHYRITARAVGPRNSVTIVQTLVR